MEYTEFDFTVIPPYPFTDILIEYLAEINFESFLETQEGVKAYIKSSDIQSFEIPKDVFPDDVIISYKKCIIPSENWNQTWENYFEHVVVENKCLIKASFHKELPSYPYEIIIDPKMSFGTAHHETTYMMIQLIMNQSISNKTVLDMGCGTAILSILASKMKAISILAIDIDEWAFNNSIENIKVNNCKNIQVIQGGAEILSLEKFDYVLANINRNILLSDIPSYVKCMRKGSILLLSGFYISDVEVINYLCESFNLFKTNQIEKNKWCALEYCMR